MITAWRLVKAKYQEGALSGEGARLYGGRWNSPGRAVLYASGSLALAALEVLVHVKSQGELANYVKLRLEFDEALMTTLNIHELPYDWRQGRAPDATRTIGDAWHETAATPVLRVPSVVIPEEWNHLVNPAHSRFPKIIVHAPERFSFDARLQPSFLGS